MLKVNKRCVKNFLQGEFSAIWLEFLLLFIILTIYNILYLYLVLGSEVRALVVLSPRHMVVNTNDIKVRFGPEQKSIFTEL